VRHDNPVWASWFARNQRAHGHRVKRALRIACRFRW
jgi:hypothetical protein